MSNGNADIGKWLRNGFDLYKSYPALLIVSTVLAILLGAFTFGILIGPLMVGLYTIVIRLVDKTEPTPKIEDVFKRFDKFLPAFLYFLIVALVYFVGVFVFAIIPGLGPILSRVFCVVWAALTMFGFPLIADRGLNFVPALQQSINTVKANFLPYTGFILLVGLASYLFGLLGTAGSLLGTFLVYPFVVAAIAVAYRDNFPKL